MALKNVETPIDKLAKMGVPTGDVNGEANYHLLSLGATTESIGNAMSKAPIVVATTQTGLPSYGLFKP